MSIIGTIRNKFTWLLLVLVGLAILAFLLMDGTNGQGGLTGQNKAVGNVEGAKITGMDLYQKSIELKDIYPNATDEQIQNTAWNELIDERLFNARYENLGLNVTKQELADLLKGENPHPYAMQVFSSLSETGQYDQFKAMEIVNDPSSHPNGEIIVRQLIHSIKGDKMNQKYASLLKAGVNTPTWLAENEFVKEYKTVNFDYVFLPFSLVDDAEVGEITEADLLKQAQENKGKYSANDGVVLQYVTFDIAPSQADSTAQMIEMQSLKTQFAATANATQFARSKTNSANVGRMFNPSMEYLNASSMAVSEPIKNQILGAPVGTIVGPLKANGDLLMVKVLDKKNMADSAKVRHILIPADSSTQDGYNSAKTLADSLATVLRRDKSKFGAFVTEYSTDPGSKNNGGVYDFFPQGRMVPSFNNAAFNNKIGDIQVVETSYGFHIVEPLARKGRSNSVKIAPLLQTVKASKETRDAAYNRAKEFEKVAQSKEGFEENAANYGGIKTTQNLSPNATTIPEIGQSYDLMRWANNNAVGAVKYFSNINGKNYVVRIKEKTVDGEMDIEKHRAELTNQIRNDRKAEVLKARIAENGGAAQPLADLASKIGRTVQSATDAKFGQSGTAIGFEPELISSLFFLSKGQVDEEITGRRGVYVVDIKDFGGVPPESDFEQYKTRLNSTMQRTANVGAVRSAMVESGKIKDERYKSR